MFMIFLIALALFVAIFYVGRMLEFDGLPKGDLFLLKSLNTRSDADSVVTDENFFSSVIKPSFEAAIAVFVVNDGQAVNECSEISAYLEKISSNVVITAVDPAAAPLVVEYLFGLISDIAADNANASGDARSFYKIHCTTPALVVFTRGAPNIWNVGFAGNVDAVKDNILRWQHNLNFTQDGVGYANFENKLKARANSKTNRKNLYLIYRYRSIFLGIMALIICAQTIRFFHWMNTPTSNREIDEISLLIPYRIACEDALLPEKIGNNIDAKLAEHALYGNPIQRDVVDNGDGSRTVTLTTEANPLEPGTCPRLYKGVCRVRDGKAQIIEQLHSAGYEAC